MCIEFYLNINHGDNLNRDYENEKIGNKKYIYWRRGNKTKQRLLLLKFEFLLKTRLLDN